MIAKLQQAETTYVSTTELDKQIKTLKDTHQTKYMKIYKDREVLHFENKALTMENNDVKTYYERLTSELDVHEKVHNNKLAGALEYL